VNHILFSELLGFWTLSTSIWSSQGTQTCNYTLVVGSALQPETIMELLEACLRTTYFQVDDKLFQQKDGMGMGSSLLPAVSNIYMQQFENRALDAAQHKPMLWLHYVDDTLLGAHS
jgi:hypothetical protein